MRRPTLSDRFACFTKSAQELSALSFAPISLNKIASSRSSCFESIFRPSVPTSSSFSWSD
jgi:hypothetical protein